MRAMKKATKTASSSSPLRATPTMNRTAREMHASILPLQQDQRPPLRSGSCAWRDLPPPPASTPTAGLPCATTTPWHGALPSPKTNGASPSSAPPEAISISRQKRAALMLLPSAAPENWTTGYGLSLIHISARQGLGRIDVFSLSGRAQTRRQQYGKQAFLHHMDQYLSLIHI